MLREESSARSKIIDTCKRPSPGFSAQRDWFKWCVVSVISVIVLWVVVKVLFVLAGS